MTEEQAKDSTSVDQEFLIRLFAAHAALTSTVCGGDPKTAAAFIRRFIDIAEAQPY